MHLSHTFFYMLIPMVCFLFIITKGGTKSIVFVFRKLGVQEDELKRAMERAELAENKLKSIEDELQTVGK